MKILSFLLFAAAAFLRLSCWESGRNRARDICSALLLQDRRGLHFSAEFKGSLEPLSGRVWHLASPRFVGNGSEDSFGGDVEVASELVGTGPVFGREVTLSGPFRCSVPLRNPGRVDDGTPSLQRPRVLAWGKGFRLRLLPEPATLLSRVHLWFRAWLDSAFRDFPGLLAFEKVIWIGDRSSLPEKLTRFYRESGIIHFLALSGQRVAGLVILATAGLSLCLRLFFFLGFSKETEPLYRELRRALPLFSAAALCLTGAGAAPVRRILALVTVHFLVRIRRWHCSRLQMIGSAVACAVLWEPELIADIGYFLSVVATVIVIQVAQETRGRDRLAVYFLLSSLMPVLIFPLSAFFFAKISWAAPLHALLMGWLWDLLLIPVGFLCPLVVVIFPARASRPILALLERAWGQLVGAQFWWSDHFGGGYSSCVRPTWLEFLLIEGFLLAIVIDTVRLLLPARGGK